MITQDDYKVWLTFVDRSPILVKRLLVVLEEAGRKALGENFQPYKWVIDMI